MADKKKIGAKGGSGDGGEVEEVAKKKGGKKKLVIGAAVVAAAAAGAYFFVLAPSDDAAAAEGDQAEETVEEEVELGDVLVIDSVSINLAGGHYLRLGLALQLSADGSAHGEPDTARALDLAIALFSQQPIEEVNDLASRAELKAELLAELEETYHGEVIDVYFTDFVTQ